MKNKTILLIGGAGYIGSVLTDHLLSAGAKVVCLDIFLYKNNSCITAFLNNPNYKFVYGNMANPVIMGKATRGVTDVVLLAGMVGEPITSKYPVAASMINDHSIKACLAFLNRKGINKVIYTSSCSNYGLINANELASETHQLNPTSSYVNDKIEIEKYLLNESHDFSPTILRFATAFGLSPRFRLDLTINEFVYEAKTLGSLSIFNPKAWRPYCHVKDLSRLIGLTLTAPFNATNKQIFNGGGEVNNYTKQGIVELIQHHVPDVQITYDDQHHDPRDYRVDFSKVKRVLGFVPEFSIESGIQEVVSALDNHIFDYIDAKKSLYRNTEITYTVDN